MNLKKIMAFALTTVLAVGCFFDQEKIDTLDAKYSVNNYFENQRQTPDRRVPRYIFIILDKIKKEKYAEAEQKFTEGYQYFPDSQALRVEYVRYLYGRGDLLQAQKKAKEYLTNYPNHVELKIYNYWLSKIINKDEDASDSMDEEFKTFNKMSLQFIRAKMKAAVKG